MVFDFPWERPRPTVEETDFNASVAPAVVPAPSSVPSQRDTSEEGAGASSGARVSHRGGVGRTRHRDNVVQITMEDDEERMDEVERRKIANDKWKQRKAQMDTELRRLKHNQRNEERAKRHSGAFIHQAFDTPEQTPQQRRLTCLSSAGVTSTRTLNSFSGRHLHVPQPRSSRSMSLQINRNEVGGWLSQQNPLIPHAEATDEEDEDEEATLGLPPKDVPYVFEERGAATNTLDMSQIPVEEIRNVTLVGSSRLESGHWNTYGEQDGSF